MSKHLDYWASKLFRKKIICKIINQFSSSSADITFKEAIPKSTKERQIPTQHGIQKVDFNAYPQTHFPSAGTFTLENALVDSKSGWVFNNNQRLVIDATWHAGFPKEIENTPIRSAVFPQQLNGTTLSIVSDFAINNYGHKLLDSFGRLFLFLRAGHKMEDIDHVLVPGKSTNRWKIICDSLGIPENKLIWADDYDFIKVDRIVFTSFPGIRRNYPPWLTNYLRSYLLKDNEGGNRKLYIHRTGRRKLLNEEEIFPILEAYKFEIYLPENSANSFLDFAQADAVIGPHGAGMTDIVFCRPGTKILELIPSDHIYEYFYTIADSADLDYSYLVGKSNKVRSPEEKGPSSSDFYIDPIEFKMAIEQFMVRES